MRHLTARKEAVLLMRYGNRRAATLEEVARAPVVSVKAVCRIERAALRRLRLDTLAGVGDGPARLG